MNLSALEDRHSVIKDLENGSLFKNSFIKISDIKSKFTEFSNFFNSTARLALLHANKAEVNEFVYLLLTLKKDLKYALSELGISQNKCYEKYGCKKCNEIINMDSDKDVWTNLQSHDHFEESLYKFLNSVDHPHQSESSNNDDLSVENNVDWEGDIDYITNATDHVEIAMVKEPSDNDVNGFRFNFELHYDRAVEMKIYPASLMKAIKKYDNCFDYSIQKSGQFRAVCLLCSRELVSRTRMSRMFILDHVTGQRHIKYASTNSSLDNLRKYHELFMSCDVFYQAHQVYFKPASDDMLTCVLCNVFVPQSYSDIQKHITKNQHKNNTLELFQQKSNIFHLTELQVVVFGNGLKLIEEKQKPNSILENKKLNKSVHRKMEKKGPSSAKDYKLNHNIIKSITKTNPSNVLDFLPNRFKEHLKDLKLKDGKIHCTACKVNLIEDMEVLKEHIRQASHLTSSQLFMRKHNYYCEICDSCIKDELEWHSHISSGDIIHKNMAESRKNRVTEYECTLCLTVIYGDELSLGRHLSLRGRNRRIVREIKLPDEIKKMFESKAKIELQSQELTDEANDTLEFNILTIQCCKTLENILGEFFMDCKAHPFGSRISGLGNKDSDLDVFIDTGGMYMGYKNQDSKIQLQFIRKAASCLSKYKNEFQNIQQIPTARTPIVKVLHATTNIECDLSFKHGLSVENTHFLRFCIDIQPITQPFILILKKWAEYMNLKEHMSNYALAIMAIFFLQIDGYLLSIKKIKQLQLAEPLVINGWETFRYNKPTYLTKAHVKIYSSSIHKLLMDFFDYYSKFPYTTDVVCPLLGEPIKKNLFAGRGEHLPMEMRTYRIQLQKEDAESFRYTTPFCVQDPFDLSHNLSKALPAAMLNKFKMFCDLTFKLLESLK